MAPGADKIKALKARMAQIGIEESDLSEKFILGSGRGGQKLQKTSSCVYLRHTPTGIDIKCQRSRSRETNRFIARCELCERFTEKILKEKTARQQKMEKLRRQKQRRSRRFKEKMLNDKRQHSKKKNLRRSTSDPE